MQRLERLDANFRLSRLELEELRNANDGVTEQVSNVNERLETFSDWAKALLGEMQESGDDIKTRVRDLGSQGPRPGILGEESGLGPRRKRSSVVREISHARNRCRSTRRARASRR
jgi:hypothetical protein